MTQATSPQVLSARLADLCERLAETSGKLAKRALIVEYLRSLDLENAARGALYLAGAPFAQTDPRTLNIGSALLTRVLTELTGADGQAMHAAYLRHGDLGAAADDLLRAHPDRRGVVARLSLSDLEDAFAAIAAVSKPAAKQRLARELLERATPLEAKYWIKIALGDMRTGVKESLVEEAIAAAYEAPIDQVRRAMTLTGNLAEVVALAGRHELPAARMRLFHPLGFMLASPVETVHEALALREAQLEDKYDGIRAQIHCGDPEQPGRVALFSRSRDDMTASFPEIVEAFAGFPEAVILDGEILAWSPGKDTGQGSPRALPFTSLQPRLGRKRVTAALREAAPVVFMAFDLLYAAGELMLERPLAERRRALEDLIRRRQPGTAVGSASLPDSLAPQSHLPFETEAMTPEPDLFARLELAPAVELRSESQLEQAYLDARRRGNEGVMLKALHSPYQPGRRGLSWLKLKRELATLDVVVTAAEYGHGKRAGVLSDYTFSVRAGDTLKVVGKAYSGLTDAEIARLSAFFLEHTLEDMGRVRTVEPLLVLEVAFNNVMRSDRHDSGFALRFPRIVRIRDDKPVSEIDTLARVQEIYRSQD
jgi:DNA ligase 1